MVLLASRFHRAEGSGVAPGSPNRSFRSLVFVSSSWAYRWAGWTHARRLQVWSTIWSPAGLGVALVVGHPVGALWLSFRADGPVPAGQRVAPDEAGTLEWDLEVCRRGVDRDVICLVNGALVGAVAWRGAGQVEQVFLLFFVSVHVPRAKF